MDKEFYVGCVIALLGRGLERQEFELVLEAYNDRKKIDEALQYIKTGASLREF
jgi:hypothetical protein